MSLITRIANYFGTETIPMKEDFQGEFSLVQTAVNRTTRDIAKFLTALKAAENKDMQERTVLYDIFQENVDYDSHLLGLIERRLENVASKDIRFIIGEDEDDDMKEWLEAPRFRQFLRDVLYTKFWGMGLFEFKKNGKGWFDYYMIPIKHINPYKMEVLRRQNDHSGVSVLNRIGRDMVFVGDRDDFGIFKTLTPLCIHKRNLMNYWSTYAELAGNNFMTINYRNIDPKRRHELETAIAAVKAGKVFQKPDGMDIEVTNMSSSQQNALFENYYKTLTEEQSKLVLGQTMTTSDGSSRSQAEVHERTQAGVMASDEKFILDFLNYTLYDYLKLWGKPEGRFSFEQDSSAQTMIEIEKDLQLKALGYTFTQEYIAEKYELPIPDDSNIRKQEEVPDQDPVEGDDVE